MKSGVLLILMLWMTGCSDENPLPQVSFYHWKTALHLDPEEQAVLSRNHVQRLYVRYMDIGVEGGNIQPLAPIQVEQLPAGVELVPVVYIENRVWKDRIVSADSLAIKTWRFIQQVNQKHGVHCSEIQIDCDWNQSTRVNYFSYLKALRFLCHLHISATVRLHQVVNPQATGVPPVERGMLMVYNMGKLQADTSNSIFSLDRAQLYAHDWDRYPLELDLALPLFHWGIHIRDQRVIALLNRWEEQDMDPQHGKKVNTRTWEITEPFERDGHYFQAHDQIKWENADAQVLEQAIQLVERTAHRPFDRIVFYDLQNNNLKYHPHDQDQFEKMAHRLR